VDPKKAFQTIEGFGEALTDAAAETFAKLPKESQRELLDAYFDPAKGIGYSLARTHNQQLPTSRARATPTRAGDVELKTSTSPPTAASACPSSGPPLPRQAPVKVYASPWSPPAWMKTNNDMLHGGKLKPEYRDAWARYYVRFVEEYEKEGVPMWGSPCRTSPWPPRPGRAASSPRGGA